MATPFRSKLVKAQSTCLPFDTILSEPLVGVGVALSDAIGCPIEFILLPLLTIIAGCMGVNAHIAINQMWKEPAISCGSSLQPTRVRKRQQHYDS